NREVRLHLDERAQPLAQDRVVLNQDYACRSVRHVLPPAPPCCGVSPCVLVGIIREFYFSLRRSCRESQCGSTWVDGAWFTLIRRRSEEHTSELQSLRHIVCRLL